MWMPSSLAEFTELIAEVQWRDPAGRCGTIAPVVQGMTAKAGKGPESPCGRVVLRVGPRPLRVARRGW